ncbi:restriction endonuclease subunit S [Kribbella sp. VKM Ac-2568]|uniref:restriction endonuclease subunit S n=1 Tax=Kribbella sp. VKM Ac-2568 TaxID=2512219 RepID=UPI0010E11D0A|nr:restriction endonuclease subunit S [Kribbella sp. VKM Ac-2568]TCM51302.1 type I restriction enzyme S subunit [Kribbella sp. VKM Ac-2568]
MPELTTSVTLGGLMDRGYVAVGDGHRAKLEELGGTGPYFLRAGNLGDSGFDWLGLERFRAIGDERLRRKIGQPGDTVITTKGNSTGRVGIVPKDAPSFVYSPHLSYWRSLDHGQIDPRYLYYWSRSPEFRAQLRAMAHGTDMAPYLSLADQARLTITLPSIDRQQAIAEVLGALDDKIIVDSDIRSSSSTLISALYDEAAMADGLTEMKLGEVLDVTFGAAFSSSHFNERRLGLPLIRIRDLKTETPQIWTTQRLPRDRVVQSGDTVAGMDGEFRPMIWAGDSGLLNQRVFYATSRIGGGAALAREILRGPLAEIEGYKTGTTVAHLNKGDLDAVAVKVPSRIALGRFESLTDPLVWRMVGAARESTALALLRDTLLPYLMAGKLRVKDAERVVGNAT